MAEYLVISRRGFRTIIPSRDIRITTICPNGDIMLQDSLCNPENPIHVSKADEADAHASVLSQLRDMGWPVDAEEKEAQNG